MTAACLALAAVVYAPLAALNWPSAVPPAKVLLALGGAGRDLHGGRLPDLLPADRRGRAGQGQRDYLHQPGDRRVLGVLVLGEHVTPVMLGAFATILAGSVLATRRARVRQRPSRGGRSPAPVPVPAADRQ